MDEHSMIVFQTEAAPAENQYNNSQRPALELIVQLCNALTAEEIDYCHWKSNAALDRSATGDNDLDFLVNRLHVQRFVEILYRLGFKEALSPKEDELPGVRDYYGYDLRTGRLVHVHAHFQLILGNDLSKNYRLPLEKVYLESSVQEGLFRIPAPEFEFVIFVIRMVLKHSTWDSILMRHGQLSSAEQRELETFSTPEMIAKAQAFLQHIPGLNSTLFNECLQTLQSGCSFWVKVRIGEKLQNLLQSTARYPHWRDILVKFTRRISQPIQRRVFGYQPKHLMASGGLFVALVGGDGSGKTTIVNELCSWLSGKFEVTALHMGKPDWSWATILVRGTLKIGTLLGLSRFEGDIFEELHRPHGLPWFLRAVCTARDRYLTYVRARQLSSNGRLVLCDRFSFPDFMEMDGAQCELAITYLKKAGRLHHWLAKWEKSYYEQIKLPDLLIVLKVEPEIAVQRKREETEMAVRARSTEVWRLNWREKSAFVIDASLGKEEVVAQAKAFVWAHL
jgi:thymidylate kinase